MCVSFKEHLTESLLDSGGSDSSLLASTQEDQLQPDCKRPGDISGKDSQFLAQLDQLEDFRIQGLLSAYHCDSVCK